MQTLFVLSKLRISYITTSKTHKHVYAFLFQNSHTNLLECHAFDCKTKCNVSLPDRGIGFLSQLHLFIFCSWNNQKAKRILKTSFIAFELAYEKYYNQKEDKHQNPLTTVNVCLEFTL